MGKPRNITIGGRYEGIAIEYVKSRKVIRISGWFDTWAGIPGAEIPLAEFCERLGITLRDLPEEAQSE